MDVQDGFKHPRAEAKDDDLRPVPVDFQERTRRKAGNARLSQQRILTA
jgi:hypothetical protein